MKYFRAVTLVSFAFVIGSAAAADTNNVFRNEAHKVSFRYPSNWESVPAQLAGTLVLLHARDGTYATCNLSVRTTDRPRVEEMDAEYWKLTLGKAWKDVFVRKVQRFEVMGQRRVFVEVDFTLQTPDDSAPATSLIVATVHRGQRYMLIMNATKKHIEDARAVFDGMGGSLMFDPQ